ncbi:MAG: polysaccharide deacetylase family protein [Agathobaculum sp.]|uniref:polysaccharide deacetylase family protein n=1 Tax=Agathobaculum sp. TaxID=2048138 RepID=UPI0025B7FD5E|nr:polysaccharide deacetylase family protein [Agathobaculum sp.]MCI7125837.1 polysaccharide deacetylase family protein [Agathobaculum sp.]MDY3711443.1 polysaccharide deacetylase family protein [Agathobaculum sp.]
MTYQQTTYRPRYRRRHRRRRNSHYGVLAVLILLIVIAVPVTVRIVKGISGVILGSDRGQVVYQMENSKAFASSGVVDLGGAAPFRDETDVALVPLSRLCDQFGMTIEWDQVSRTATVKYKKDTARVQADSQTLRFNDQTLTMNAKVRVVNGETYVPARDFCEAFSWQVDELSAEQGGLLIITKSKKALSEKNLQAAASDAIATLGPSRQQLLDGSVVMRVQSDKVLANGASAQMSGEGKRTGEAVVEVDGMPYIPLRAGITALGGTAAFDGQKEWNVSYNGVAATVSADGKAKIDGKRVKGDGIAAYQDEETGVFRVSAPLFAALIGRTYTKLDDGSGMLAFTKMSLDGFDSQKAYLSGMQEQLTAALSGNIPEADAYIALTFDDGPTGAMGAYAKGLTASLLDGLKERGAHATFFMCGYRIKDFNSHMARYLAEGHELGNHTMDHPAVKLTGLDADGVYDQVSSTSDLIASFTSHKPTVMRPVGGGVNGTVKEQMRGLGLPIVNWSLDTEDWRVRDAESVKNAIVSKVKDGDIVLMHDIYPTTVQGVLAAIDELQSRTDKTYAFVTVSELAAIKGISLEAGVVYNDLSDATAQSIADGTYSPTEFS